MAKAARGRRRRCQWDRGRFIRRPRDAEEPALRRYGVAALTFERISAPLVLRRRPPSGVYDSRARAPGSGSARACGCPRRAASRSRLST